MPTRDRIGGRDRAERPRGRIGAHGAEGLHTTREERADPFGARTARQGGEAHVGQQGVDAGEEFPDVGLGPPARPREAEQVDEDSTGGHQLSMTASGRCSRRGVVSTPEKKLIITVWKPRMISSALGTAMRTACAAFC